MSDTEAMEWEVRTKLSLDDKYVFHLLLGSSGGNTGRMHSICIREHNGVWQIDATGDTRFIWVDMPGVTSEQEAKTMAFAYYRMGLS